MALIEQSTLFVRPFSLVDFIAQSAIAMNSVGKLMNPIYLS